MTGCTLDDLLFGYWSTCMFMSSWQRERIAVLVVFHLLPLMMMCFWTGSCSGRFYMALVELSLHPLLEAAFSIVHLFKRFHERPPPLPEVGLAPSRVKDWEVETRWRKENAFQMNKCLFVICGYMLSVIACFSFSSVLWLDRWSNWNK